ncbi:MAG: hypothetical protein R6X08_13215 [Desulfosalsimonadaceae bacterium]
MSQKRLRTCVHPSGKFVYGIHRPSYQVENLRENDFVCELGWCPDGTACENRENFPEDRVCVPDADPVFEVPNAFAFRGATFILKRWADGNSSRPEKISLPSAPEVSFGKTLEKWAEKGSAPRASRLAELLADLPEPLQLAVAETSTDPEDLECLAALSCSFIYDEQSGRPRGLQYETGADGAMRPRIHCPMLFEITANNHKLPDDYKEVMVLRPGAQGASAIVGEYADPAAGTHVFEYLRENSYIPDGHYAANNAHDAIRYRAADISPRDMEAMRHFYYQRSYIRLAEELGISINCRRRMLCRDELEGLRREVRAALEDPQAAANLSHNRTLWGWNFGFDYAPSGYRLHASHQQVHQQYAMVPVDFEASADDAIQLRPFACGDLIADFIADYRRLTGVSFFDAYIRAILDNGRMDGKKGESSLVVYSDENVLLFVPKAQTSQWELQLMTLPAVGNIVEADQQMRDCIDRAMLVALRVLEALGARMITTIEYSRALDESEKSGQRLIYSFMPRLPESPGAFSEAQMRWINGHYPEDFARACRNKLPHAAPFLS